MASKLKIVADDKIPFLRGVLEPYAEVKYLPGAAIGPDDVCDADALVIRTRTHCNRALLEHSSVRFITSATIGFDHIDTSYLAEKKIAWTNCPGCNSGSVAQYFAGVVSEVFPSPAGKILGIVGVGHVGAKVAAVARTLGMTVLQNDPPRARTEGDAAFVTKEELLARADFITLHVPLIKSGEDRTFQLADTSFFQAMKPGAVFMNSSRGTVVEPLALKSAIRAGRLQACVLDVWPDEPGIDRELLAMTTFGTPHIAGYSADGKANGTGMSVRALAKFFGIAPLLDYQVTNVPVPANPVWNLDQISPAAAIAAGYTPAEDSRKLKEHSEKFEFFRGNYPIRRECSAFRFTGGTPSLRHSLETLQEFLAK